MVRGRRPRREGRRDPRRPPRGPARPDPRLPARAGLPPRRSAGRAHRRPPAAAAGPARRARAAAARTASGSRAVGPTRARVAPRPRGSSSRAATTPSSSRRSGATDLRVEGVVVEMLDGVDDLEDAVRDFAPGPGRRMGSSSTTSSRARRSGPSPSGPGRLRPYAAHVLVVGHPFVDVWQSVRPERLGIEALAARSRAEPPGRPAIVAHLGWPNRIPGGPRPGLAADPRHGPGLRRSRAGAARPGRGAHRLRHRAHRAG